ncbi:MAG: hypothetical protein Athens071416_117 [Parcubacteria group bacterium Athens0714_16]|nr:MAG: hypothetical protein Athens071416_117 [Parcubacteria group bacterium Athens0714_16]
MFVYILFIISLLGLTMLFCFKIFEFQKDRVVISENIKNHLERKTKKHLSILNFYASYFNRRNAIRFVFFIYEEIKTFVVRIFHIAVKKVKNSDSKIVNIIMGKKVLRRDGEVSSFLNDIADFKRESNENRPDIDNTIV